MAIDKELKERDMAQAKKVKANKKDLLKKLESETTMRVQVRNHDFVNQGVPLEFNYQGIRKYVIKDSEETELPLSVIDHINRLQVPDSRWETDEKTGQLKHVVFKRKRWSALPVGGFASQVKPPDLSRGKEKAA